MNLEPKFFLLQALALSISIIILGTRNFMPVQSELTNTGEGHSNVSDNECVRLLQGAAYSAFQRPLQATVQMIDQSSNLNLRTPEICPRADQKKFDIWWQAGELVGSVADFMLISKMTRSSLSGAGLVKSNTPITAVESALTGGSSELINPLDQAELNKCEKTTGHSFWRQKTDATIRSAATFAAMTRTNNYLHNLGIGGRIGRRPLLSAIAINAATGLSGAVTDDLFHHIQDPNLRGSLIGGMTHYVGFGALLGVGEGLLSKRAINLNSFKAETEHCVPTEQLIGRKDALNVESPILTWIAENRPNLRPQEYVPYTEKATTSHAKLGDWLPEQRHSVLKEVRYLARNSTLASDRNIDAFIARLPESNLQSYKESYNSPQTTDHFSKWNNASKALKALVQNDSQLREFRLKDMVKDEEFLLKNPDLKKLVDEVEASESKYHAALQQTIKESKIDTAMFDTLNQISRDAGLPPIKEFHVEPNDRGAGYYPFLRELQIGDGALEDGKSALAADSALHEMVHHEQGLPNLFSKPARNPGIHESACTHLAQETDLLERPNGALDLLCRISRPSTNTSKYLSAGGGLPRSIVSLVDAAKEGAIDVNRWKEIEVRDMLRDLIATKEQFHRVAIRRLYMDYVGSPEELPAWSAGYLTELRAQAAGLPYNARSKAAPINISEYR